MVYTNRMMHTNKNLVVSFLIVAVFISIVGWLISRPRVMTRTSTPNTPPAGVETQSISLGMLCDEGKSITATIHLPDDEAVDLVFSDGRTMTLPHAISADGARYTNTDESVVFWTKGETAFVTEGKESAMTYKNCVVDTVTPDWMMEN